MNVAEFFTPRFTYLSLTLPLLIPIVTWVRWRWPSCPSSFLWVCPRVWCPSYACDRTTSIRNRSAGGPKRWSRSRSLVAANKKRERVNWIERTTIDVSRVSRRAKNLPPHILRRDKSAKRSGSGKNKTKKKQSQMWNGVYDSYTILLVWK